MTAAKWSARSRPGPPLWTPSPRRQQDAELTRYLAWLTLERGLNFGSYAELHRWSVDDLAGFWESLWAYFRPDAATEPQTILSNPQMPGCHWFEGARLNYAANALRGPASRDALVGISESGAVRSLTYAELRTEVAAISCGLRELGVVPGDRVAAYLPNVIEAVCCLLACAAIGAVFCVCPPEFGVSGTLSRLARLRPKVLIAADGYYYGGRAYQRLGVVQQICRGLPGLRHLVVLPVLADDGSPAITSSGLTWSDLRRSGTELEFEQLPFEHPLWVLFSSGTTGKPKAIVHSHGGIVLEHLKSLTLHRDVRPGDRVMWLTSVGWMMWNYIIGSLLVGATVVLVDGSPAYPSLIRPWEIVNAQHVNMFGAGASYLEACRAAGLRPGDGLDLQQLRSLGSTGSALPAACYDWVYDAVLADVMLSPASGGTDICSAFMGPCPVLPLWREEMQCLMLGASVEAYDPDGRPLVDQVGELVVTRPMPSMPICLWDDPGGHQLREAYFSRFDGVWDHGDWVLITARGTARVLGRSDAALNRGGIRIGTEEYYRVLEQQPEIVDSLIVDVPATEAGSELILFVVPAPDLAWTEDAAARIRAHIRSELSPRHVPDHVYPVTAVPRTFTGKRLEVPVKRIMSGEPPEAVLSIDTVADPQSVADVLSWYRTRAGPSGSPEPVSRTGRLDNA